MWARLKGPGEDEEGARCAEGAWRPGHISCPKAVDRWPTGAGAGAWNLGAARPGMRTTLPWGAGESRRQPAGVCTHELSGRTLGSWAAVWCFVSGSGGLGEFSRPLANLPLGRARRAGSCPAGLRIASPSPACVHGNRILSLQTAWISEIAGGAWELGSPRGMGAAGLRLVPKEAGGSQGFSALLEPFLFLYTFVVRKPEAGRGKVRGQPRISDISGA